MSPTICPVPMVSGVALSGDDARRSPRESPRIGDVVTEFTNRLAVLADVPALTVVMDAAISELQRDFLDDAEIASSRAIMGMDTPLRRASLHCLWVPAT